MPPGGRRIPRAPAPRRTRRDVGGDDEKLPDIVAKAGGDLVALAAQIRTCRSCGRGCDEPVYGTGHPRAPVMLINDRPTAADLESGGAFTAEAEALEKAFAALDIPLSWVYGTTVVHCGTEPVTADQIAACSAHLLVEVEAVEPSVIVAFGPVAADAVRALDGRCGISVPDELPQGTAVRLRPGLSFVATEPLQQGLTHKDAKRRLWRDLQQVRELIGHRVGA